MVLAGCALLVGMVFGPTGLFEHHLARTPGLELTSRGEAGHPGGWLTPLIGTTAGVLGLGLSWLLYAAPSPIPGRLAETLRPLYLASRNKFYVDELYDFFIVAPTRGLAALCGYLDFKLIDDLVRGIAEVPRWAGRNILAPFQNGLIQFYAAVTALGVAVLLVILLFL
jgi:NADH-quinone oxidoreductase subunit L